MIPYTDTHCHLDFPSYDEDREQVLQRAWKAGLQWIINPGIDLQTSQAAITLANTFPDKISAAVGIHPNVGKPWSAANLSALLEQAQQPGVVAIGEIGLDYYRQHTPVDQQQTMFREQLALAADLNLPIIIHNREATHDLMLLLREWTEGLVETGNPLMQHPGVLHSFSADFKTAQAAIEMNFMIGISGPVTFKNASDLQAIVRQIPLNHLLLETDAPFLTPHPHRGKRNEPAYIPLIAEAIARLHQCSLGQVAEITYQNACQLFRPSN